VPLAAAAAAAAARSFREAFPRFLRSRMYSHVRPNSGTGVSLLCLLLTAPPAVRTAWWSLVEQTHLYSGRTTTALAGGSVAGHATYRRLSIALGAQLVALVARPTDAAPYGASRGNAASGALVEHGFALAARCGRQGPAGIGQPVLAHQLATGAGQDMAVLVELQGILRGVGQRIERRGPQVVLGSKVVMLMLHRRRELLVLVERCGHHLLAPSRPRHAREEGTSNGGQWR